MKKTPIKIKTDNSIERIERFRNELIVANAHLFHFCMESFSFKIELDGTPIFGITFHGVQNMKRIFIPEMEPGWVIDFVANDRLKADLIVFGLKEIKTKTQFNFHRISSVYFVNTEIVHPTFCVNHPLRVSFCNIKDYEGYGAGEWHRCLKWFLVSDTGVKDTFVTLGCTSFNLKKAQERIVNKYYYGNSKIIADLGSEYLDILSISHKKFLDKLNGQTSFFTEEKTVEENTSLDVNNQRNLLVVKRNMQQKEFLDAQCYYLNNFTIKKS